MNFFKKALVATAVVASFGASAAKITPSTTILEISKEGIAAGVATPDTGFDINVKVEANTPAASHLKITFGADVDLTTPAAAITGTVDNSVAGTSSDGDMVITFGTGSFTFDNFAIDTTTAGAHFVTFDVSLGQPMNSGAAFNVTFASGAVAKASVASYTATDGTVIDSGNGAISVEVDQYTFAVKTPLDKLINRTDDEAFTDATTEDDLVLSVSDDQGLSRAVTTAPTYAAAVTGVFTDILAADLATGLTGPATMVVADKVIGVPVVPADITLDGTKTDLTLTIDPALDATDVVIPATGDVKVAWTVTSADFTAGSLVITTAADGGEWAVDATIINYPYMPLGYEGVQSTIQLANESSSAVDVIVTANDKNGAQYGPVNLNTLAGFESGLPKMAVSKLSDVALMELLSAPAGSSLSITFNIDANEGVVNGYGYTQKAGTGRSEVSSSQQRGN
jgi:hypothetical protein